MVERAAEDEREGRDDEGLGDGRGARRAGGRRERLIVVVVIPVVVLGAVRDPRGPGDRDDDEGAVAEDRDRAAVVEVDALEEAALEEAARHGRAEVAARRLGGLDGARVADRVRAQAAVSAVERPLQAPRRRRHLVVVLARRHAGERRRRRLAAAQLGGHRRRRRVRHRWRALAGGGLRRSRPPSTVVVGRRRSRPRLVLPGGGAR
mmetsp:Transcript_12797/g.51327  ORF Transcript_12797/g.51327 Transcript_12797/m.51327 type:complete len:206 (-) Transcript_12797:20-637(-)